MNTFATSPYEVGISIEPVVLNHLDVPEIEGWIASLLVQSDGPGIRISDEQGHERTVHLSEFNGAVWTTETLIPLLAQELSRRDQEMKRAADLISNFDPQRS